ncbi:hypothetical protein C8039_19155 [Halogeometricum sp. wsp3]|nr:hypothetical protein C8039_19155 [Halogeometricum sp. wsp3]
MIPRWLATYVTIVPTVAVNRTGGQLQGQYQQLTDRTSLDLDEEASTTAVVENTTETSEQR